MKKKKSCDLIECGTEGRNNVFLFFTYYGDSCHRLLQLPLVASSDNGRKAPIGLDVQVVCVVVIATLCVVVIAILHFL